MVHRFADVVLIKTDLASPEQLETARMLVRALNADARVIEARFADVPPVEVLDTGGFDVDEAELHQL